MAGIALFQLMQFRAHWHDRTAMKIPNRLDKQNYFPDRLDLLQI